MPENAHPEIAPRAFRGLLGVARRDVTPPVGIYARQWGAALHDVAEGVHRPLTMTVLVLRASAAEAPVALVALDGGWFRAAEDEWAVRGAAAEALGVDGSRVLLNLSHTHAACSLSSVDADKPGGHLIGPYLEALARAAGKASREAAESVVPGTLTAAAISPSTAICPTPIPKPTALSWPTTPMAPPRIRS